jgi:hypothetical protein
MRSASQLPLLFFLRLWRRLRPNAFGIATPFPIPFRFRLNSGFVAGFFRLNALGFSTPYPFISVSFLHTRSLPETVSVSFPLTEWRLRRGLRLNTFGIAAPSPCPTRFRLNGGFVAGFLRLNAFGFSTPYSILSYSTYLSIDLFCLLFPFLRMCRFLFL